MRSLSFRRALLVSVMRMKTPLKYGMRIYLASSFNYKLVIAPESVLSSLWRVFFSLLLRLVRSERRGLVEELLREEIFREDAS